MLVLLLIVSELEVEDVIGIDICYIIIISNVGELSFVVFDV